MKLKIWIDSGANNFSYNEEIIEIDELCIDEKEFIENPDKFEDEIRDLAFARLNAEWGYEIIEEQNNAD